MTTFGLETCVCEIARLCLSLADFVLGLLEVLLLLLLLFRTRPHLVGLLCERVRLKINAGPSARDDSDVGWRVAGVLVS